VDSPDDLAPHDHVAWYGDGAEDLYALATTALADGARRGEKLMFVAADPDADRLGGIDDLDRLLDGGQLEVVDTRDVYGANGSFSASAQLATFEGVLADALASGYSGIRVVADNTPLVSGSEEHFQHWLKWEQVTDRFQAQSNVTGICYFDRGAICEERQSDLASLHPVRVANGAEPPFSFFVDGDAVAITGTLDAWSADQFRRILGASPGVRELVVDLSHAEFVDHRAVLALSSIASPERSINVRGAPGIVRRMPALLSISTPYLRFE
jgi:hypothetical protein